MPDTPLHPAPKPAPGRDSLADPRTALIVSIESTTLAARYIAYVVLVALYAMGFTHGFLPDLVIVTAVGVAQNGWVHYVLYVQRYAHFLSPFNFLLHLAVVSIMVGLTGGGDSPLGALYLLIIIGYGLYSRNARRMTAVTAIACIAYTATLLAQWALSGAVGIENQALPIFGAIVMAGWLMGAASSMIRRVELDARGQSQALLRSEATLRTILNSTAGPIIVYDEQEFITDVNQRAVEFLGEPREKLLGRRVRNFAFDDGTLPNKFAALRKRGEYEGEILAVPASGDERNVHLHVRSFLRDGRRFYVAILRDITEDKQLAEMSRTTQEQLARANRELQRVNSMRAALFVTVARRLRSPLAAVIGYCELLLNGDLEPLSDRQVRAIRNIRRGVGRVLNLVDDTLPVEAPPSETVGDSAPPTAASNAAEPVQAGAAPPETDRETNA